MAIGPWLLAAAALAPKVIDIFAGDDKDDEARKRIEQERELFGRRQQLDSDARGWGITQAAADLMGSSEGYDPRNVPFDLGTGNVRRAASLEGDNRLWDANQGLQRDAQELDWQRQIQEAEDQESQESGWQSWISPLLGAAGALSSKGGPFGGDDGTSALQAKRDRLNTLSDDVDFAREGLQAGSYAASAANQPGHYTSWSPEQTPFVEAEERRRSIFNGPARRMNIHQF